MTEMNSIHRVMFNLILIASGTLVFFETESTCFALPNFLKQRVRDYPKSRSSGGSSPTNDILVQDDTANCRNAYHPGQNILPQYPTISEILIEISDYYKMTRPGEKIPEDVLPGISWFGFDSYPGLSAKDVKLAKVAYRRSKKNPLMARFTLQDYLIKIAKDRKQSEFEELIRTRKMELEKKGLSETAIKADQEAESARFEFEKNDALVLEERAELRNLIKLEEKNRKKNPSEFYGIKGSEYLIRKNQKLDWIKSYIKDGKNLKKIAKRLDEIRRKILSQEISEIENNKKMEEDNNTSIIKLNEKVSTLENKVKKDPTNKEKQILLQIAQIDLQLAEDFKLSFQAVRESKNEKKLITAKLKQEKTNLDQARAADQVIDKLERQRNKNIKLSEKEIEEKNKSRAIALEQAKKSLGQAREQARDIDEAIKIANDWKYAHVSYNKTFYDNRTIWDKISYEEKNKSSSRWNIFSSNKLKNRIYSLKNGKYDKEFIDVNYKTSSAKALYIAKEAERLEKKSNFTAEELEILVGIQASIEAHKSSDKKFVKQQKFKEYLEKFTEAKEAQNEAKQLALEANKIAAPYKEQKRVLIEEQQKKWNPVLFDALNSDNLSSVEESIEKGANVNGFDSRGYTPLYILTMKAIRALRPELVNDDLTFKEMNRPQSEGSPENDSDLPNSKADTSKVRSETDIAAFDSTRRMISKLMDQYHADSYLNNSKVNSESANSAILAAQKSNLRSLIELLE